MKRKLDNVIKMFLAEEGKEKPMDFDSENEFENKLKFNLAVKRDYLDRFAKLKEKYKKPIQEIGLDKRVFEIKEYKPGETIQEFMVAAFTPDEDFILSDVSDDTTNLGILREDVIESFLEEE